MGQNERSALITRTLADFPMLLVFPDKVYHLGRLPIDYSSILPLCTGSRMATLLSSRAYFQFPSNQLAMLLGSGGGAVIGAGVRGALFKK